MTKSFDNTTEMMVDTFNTYYFMTPTEQKQLKEEIQKICVSAVNSWEHNQRV